MAEKIVVRGVNWIGDAVMTMPALKALRKAFPDSHLSLLVKPSVSPLFDLDPHIDEIILYGERFKGFGGKLRLVRALRGKGFSRAVLFQNAFEAAMIAFLAGIPERIGYERDGRGFLLTRKVPFRGDDRKVHHIAYYLNLLSAAGISAGTENHRPWIHLSLEERMKARVIAGKLKRPILGINPGAAFGSSKRWFPDRFAEVAKWFIRDTGGSAVIFGGTKETAIAQEIELLAGLETGLSSRPTDIMEREPRGSSLLNMAGKTSLRELIALISECDVFVTNDSGPMHIACAVGTPVVAIFGSTSPELTGPVGEADIVIRNDFDCSPCFDRTCENSDMRCMYAVTSDDVYLGIKRLIPGRKAVFFDRDGTLCRDAGYLNSWNDFEISPGIENLRLLKEKGFALIGITNQSGIARGIVDDLFVQEVNRVFTERYGFEGFYYCPHHPDEHCSCRKPEPGMLLTARGKHRIDLRNSYVVGDKESDLILAGTVGAKAILVGTGRRERPHNADFAARGLKEAIDFILEDARI